MGNLIRAEFYRLRRRPHSVLGMALILLLGVSLLTVSCALPPQVGSAATLLQSISTLSVSGMFFCRLVRCRRQLRRQQAGYPEA